MRKIRLTALTTLMVILTSAFAIHGITTVSAAPEVKRVGLVVAYTPGDSITIMDKDGDQYMFELGSPLKILPPNRANDLAVGMYVTIIAPNNIPNGKHTAVGIVIHPDAPAGFPLPTATFTPFPTDTLVPTETELPTETATETPVTVESPTEGVNATETSTENATPTGTLTVDPPTSTETLVVTALTPDDARSAMDAFMEWLAALFRQILSN